MSAHVSVPQHQVRADVGQGMQALPGMSWSVDRTLSGEGLPGQARAATGSSLASGSLSIRDSRTPWRGPAIAAGGAVHIDAALDAGAPLTRVATMRSRSVDAAGARVLERGLIIEDDARGLLGPVASPASVPATPVDLSTVLVTLATSLGLAHDVAPSGVLVPAILPEGRTGWEICQWVARVTLGACWLSETGVLTYRGPAAMRGQGTPRETIHTLPQVVDLPWQMSTDDVADRVTLTYTPITVERVSDQSLTVWESTETLTVAAGATAVLEQDLEVAVDALASWLPIWSTAAPEAQRSRWAASTQPDDGGERPADGALTVSATLVTASRVRITIKNNSASTLYVGGGRPTQLLILRANVRASRSAQVTLAAGADEALARATLAVDMGTGITDEAAARTLLAWLAAQTASPRATLSQIQVVPDLARRLGDLVEIVDPITGLSSRCIIAGVHLAAQAGSLTQSLDLTLVDGVVPAPPMVVPVVTGDAGTSSSAGISAVERSRLDTMEREDRSQPSVPSAPVLTARLGVLSITWDGLTNLGGEVSSNLSHVEVALGDATGPTTVIDRIERGGGTVHITGLPYNALRYVRLRAVSRNRIPSAWGPERSQQVTPLVNADLIGQVIAEANLGDNVVTARTILAGSVTTAALDALAVTADKIAANAITADKILAGAITGIKIAGDAIDGKVITGATIRTAASGQRVQIDTSGLRAYNAAGTLVTSIALPGGTLSTTGASIDGTMSASGTGGTTTISGSGLIQRTSDRGVDIQSGGIWFGVGSPNIRVASLTYDGEAILNTIVGSLSMRAPAGNATMTSRTTRVAGTVAVNIDSPGPISVVAGGNLDINSNGYSQLALRADSNGSYISAPSVNFRSYRPNGGTISFVTANQNGTLATWGSGEATTPGDLISSGRLIANMTLRSIGFESTSASASCVMTTGGWLQRSTSLAAAKVAVEDLVLDGIAVTRALRPRTWHDRGSAERLADGLDRQARGEDVDWDELAVEYPERIPGFIAEEVAALNLPAGFAMRDPDGNLSGLAYDRIPAIHTLAIQQLADLIDELTARLTALEGAA